MKKKQKFQIISSGGNREELKSRTVEGAIWNILLALANKAVTFGGQLVLAWYLLPADMGLANIALAMSAFVAFLSVGGLSDVLLQRGRFDEEAGQGLWLIIGFSISMALAICGIALISPTFGIPNIKGLLLILAFSTLVSSPCTVLLAGLKNALDFKGVALSYFASSLFYTITAVILAKFKWGPFALIVPIPFQYMVMMASLILRGSRVSFVKPSISLLQALIKPTFALAISGFFTSLQSQVPIFVCGFHLGTTQTGYFSWGWAIASQTVFLLAINLREVFFPMFTRLKADDNYRARVALKIARAITALLCATCGAQALLAGPMIGLLVPNKWLPAVPVVMIASFGLVLQGLWVSGMAWLNACGRYRLLLKLSASQTCVTAGFTYVGVLFGGVKGAAIGCSLAALVGALISVMPMNWKTLADHFKSWWQPLGLTFLIWWCCYFLTIGRGLILQSSICIFFIIITEWLWWQKDDGGLKTVKMKLQEVFISFKRDIKNLA